MIAAAAMPYLIAGAFAAGLAMGGTGAWKWQAGEVQERQNKIDQLTGAAALAKQMADSAAQQAQVTIDGLSTDLAQSWRLRSTVFVDVIKEVTVVASPDRVCLTPRVRTVLNRAADPVLSRGPDPGVAVASAGSAPADTGGLVVGASELATSGWIAGAFRKYADARDQIGAQANTIRSLPCVRVTQGVTP